jgi:hypothetical protein
MDVPSISLKSEEGLEPDEAMRLSAELSLLSGQQYEALQKASYPRMSDAERNAYDRRRVRIGELGSLLENVRPQLQVSAESIWPKTPRQVGSLGEQ